MRLSQLLSGSLFTVLLTLGSCGGSGTCSTNTSDHKILSVGKFILVKLQVTHFDGVTNGDVVNINNNALGNVGIDTFNLHLLHAQVELTTSFNTHCVTLNLNRNLNNNRFLLVYLEEINV